MATIKRERERDIYIYKKKKKKKKNKILRKISFFQLTCVLRHEVPISTVDVSERFMYGPEWKAPIHDFDALSRRIINRQRSGCLECREITTKLWGFNVVKSWICN